MSKTISVQIELATSMAAEVKKRMAEMQAKGCDVSEAKIAALAAEAARLQACDEKKEAMREELSQYTAQVNEDFLSFKEEVGTLKKMIKENYDQYRWKEFGIPDKQR